MRQIVVLQSWYHVSIDQYMLCFYFKRQTQADQGSAVRYDRACRCWDLRFGYPDEKEIAIKNYEPSKFRPCKITSSANFQHQKL